MDEAVDHFMAFTGATAEVARRYLGLTENNSEQAVQLFFDSPELASGLDEVPQQSTPHVPASMRPEARPVADEDNLIELSDGDNMDVDDDVEEDTENARVAAIVRAAEVEDDEAMARRMQEELYAGGESNAGFDADGVRAPIGRRTETLVGEPNDGDYDSDMNAAIMQQMRARQNRPGRLGVFNQAPVSSIWDSNAEPQERRQGLSRATGGASETSSKAQRLAELFRPPFELMHQVPFDVAREKGKEELKWILVNVQDTSIFDCQQLNRDIWKHDGIKELVKENFIFVQYSKDDPRGETYMQYYFPLRDSDSAYPHIAIVDPRTGEQVKVWSGPPVPIAGEFMMQLVEFLDRYSLDVTKKNPVAKRKPEKPKSLDVDKLTEEEMLDLALQNSLANAGNTGPSAPKHEDPDDLTKSFGDVGKGKGKEVAEDTEEAETSNGVDPDSPFTGIASDHPHEEPGTGPGITRIQIRHPNGRIVRRFNENDPVTRIYEWLKASPLEGREGVAFDLKGMGKDLIGYLDESIKDAGLNNGTVMIEFAED
jgi:hypothetical protein